ncbi:MAG: hypothetical protein AVDCRST_MAG26-1500 [uncultured Chloroflexia bacterium]|uniref:Asp23/Gls24 family envelope stress response protein n=1 Tax=uncultured Chloroflexia bacterium TaxID=1672391 RepID=A0A6J4I5M2_9CHLR|nr:MAG: hypothetical protein AVDCRST_MAG26-1500 [uncultured Chloroflexia bacterium]
MAPRAIASLVAHAVSRSYGVVGMAPARLRDYAGQVLRKEDQHRGIGVHISKDKITIDIYIVVAYGTRISEVAQQVLATVSYALQRSLGLPVAAINVHVQGVRAQ